MKRWLIVLAACSSKKQSPQPAPPPPPVARPDAAPATPRPTMKSSQPIDLPELGITAVQVLPVAGEKGVFDLHWNEDKRHDTGIVCRIESYNLAYFGDPDRDAGAKPNEHEVLYRPDPFVLEPKVCEVRFLDDHHEVVARTCYQDGTMSAAPCPAGTFVPPKLPDKMAIDIQGASVHRNNTSGLQVKALFTVGKQVDKASFAIRCDGIDSESDPGEGFVPLSRLAAGETLYTWELAFFMKQPLAADPKQCELRVLSKGKTLGVACIAEGETDAGPCPK